jgi:hypothetical protein
MTKHVCFTVSLSRCLISSLSAVAGRVWETMAEITGYPLIQCFEDLGKLWLLGKKSHVINVFNTVMLWSL